MNPHPPDNQGSLIIGIDPGTARTGFGIIRQKPSGKLDVIDYGIITTPVGQAMAARLKDLYASLVQIIEKYHPESSAVEKLFFQRNVSTAMSVGQAKGVAILALAQAEISVEEYSPSEIKLAVSGYGGADKRQMQEMVKVILKMKSLPKPDDAADALAVAICHCHSRKIRSLGEHK